MIKERRSTFQKLVDSTDHIHEEIAELSRKYVLEGKKNSEHEEEELLISIDD